MPPPPPAAPHSGRGLGRSSGGGSDARGDRRRPNALARFQLKSFRFSSSNSNVTKSSKDGSKTTTTTANSRGSIVRRRNSAAAADNTLPEEGSSLHHHFQTCASLSRIREEFRATMEDESENKKMGFGLNCCARPEESTGRLLAHSIGLNANLIASGGGGSIGIMGGGTAVALSRVNNFIMQELLPAYPSAIIEEDDNGRIPFTEPIIRWVEARRAVRKWKLETDLTREKVALVSRRLQQRLGGGASIYMQHSVDASDSDSEASLPSASEMPKKRLARCSTSRFTMRREDHEKVARRDLKMIVESANDAMFCIDERGHILLTNDAAAKKFGYSKKELKGSNISILMNKHDRQNHDGYLESYMKTGVKKVMGKKRELTAMRKDGSTFQFELGLTEVKLGGGKAIFIGFCKDTASLKQHKLSLEFGSDLAEFDDEEEHTASNDEVQNARGLPKLVEWCLTMLGDIVDSGTNIQDLAARRRGSSGNNVDDDSIEDLLGASFTSVGGLNESITNNRSSILGSRLERQSSFLKLMDTSIVEHVASIPNLLEELLLIEDPETRQRVFDMSIVKKVLFSIDSIGSGDWIISMLDKSVSVQQTQQVLDSNLSGSDYGDTAEGRAFQLKLQVVKEECRNLAESVIFYLERVSALNIQDDLSVFHHLQMTQQVTRRSSGFADMVSAGDLQHFKRHRDEIFDAVGALGRSRGLIRRICVLDDDLVKRAAATSVIRRLLDRVMFSPFATIQALMDGINHFVLMLSFRLGPAAVLMHLSARDLDFNPHLYLFFTCTLMLSISYFGTKAIHTSIARYNLSRNLFWNDALSFWSLLDWCPLLMVLISAVAVDTVLRNKASSNIDDNTIPFYLRSAVAITTPFLWLRILAFIKVRNKQLATFILCSVEILKDIKWFLLVLFAAMASFAQMWVTLTAETGEAASYLAGYITAYTIMLGDLDSDSLQRHPLITMIFILYTFGVTIVLLNILIAIVSDSYQNSYVSSKMMLGKARILFVSEISSLRGYHHSWMKGEASDGLLSRRNINYFFGVVSVLHVWMVTKTINQKLGQFESCEINGTSPKRINLEAMVLFVSLAFTLAGMKMIVAHVLNEFNDTGKLRDANKSVSTTKRAVNWFIENMFSNLSSTFDSLFDKSDNDILEGFKMESTGTQEQRSEQNIHRSIEKSKKQLKHELKSMFEQMQFSLKEQEEQSKRELASLEERITNSLVATLAESQQSLLESLQAGADLGRFISYDEANENGSSGSISLGLDDTEVNGSVPNGAVRQT